MKTRFSGLSVAVAYAGLLFLAFAPPTQAAFELTLADNAGNKVTLNSDDGCDTDGITGGCTVFTIDTVNGIAVYSGSVGGFVVNVTTGLAQPLLTYPELMALNSVNVQGGSAGEMSITWSQTGWSGIPGFEMSAGGVLTAGAGSSVTYQAFTGDELSATSALIGSLGAFGPGAYSGTVVAGAAPGGTYSLTQKLSYVFTSSGVTSGGYNLAATSVPEPWSVEIIGAAVVLACGAVRRKLRRQAS